MSRFSDLEAKLAAKGAEDPGGLARYIGQKKYGHAGFAALTKAGREKKKLEKAGAKDASKDDDKRSLMAEFLRADPVEVARSRAYYVEDISVRSDGDGRTVDAYAAAFGIPAEVRDQDGHYNEILSPGSFDKTIAERGLRLNVLYNHGRTLYGTPDGMLSVPIGVPVEVPKADSHGVLTATRYLNNPLADSVLDAIKQRAITGQSFTGRFIQSKRTRSNMQGGLPTIARHEVAWTEYGPTPLPTYQDAHVVGTRSAQMWMTDILAMDSAERAELFAQMVALATPLVPPAATEPVREVINVSAQRTTEVETPATPPEPATEDATATEAAGTAEEPHTHSARQSDIARRARVARITREVVGL